MKRFHVHLAVADLDQSTDFYSRLFGQRPTVERPGYAKWMLDDPRLNFAITTARGGAGIEHLGVQVDSDEELGALRDRMTGAGGAIKDEQAANCCYAISDKHWTADPQGIVWEAFHTLRQADEFGEDRGLAAAATGASAAQASSCCMPRASGCC